MGEIGVNKNTDDLLRPARAKEVIQQDAANQARRFWALSEPKTPEDPAVMGR
jgi:hypothetical protein